MSVKNKTNVEFVTELMEFAESGPLMQAFVIDAIGKAAEAMVEAGPDAFPSTGLVSSQAWYACAKEALEKVGAKYGYGGVKKAA